MIVDAHAHVSTSPWPVEDLLGRLGCAGVDRAVLIQPGSYGYDHAYLTSVLARESSVAGVCLVDPRRPDAPEELHRRCEEGYRGLRLTGLGHGDAAWLFDHRTDALWRAADELDLVVSLLIDPHQLASVGAVAARHPGLGIAIDHLGRCRPGAPEVEELLALAGWPNVSVKVSALSWLSQETRPYADLRPMIAACLSEFGASRLLWGTDYPHALSAGPYPSPRDELRAVLPDATEAELALVAGGNAARLYGLL